MLPQHLFQDDFNQFLKASIKETYKAFDALDESAECTQTVQEVTYSNCVDIEHPLVDKLGLYTRAHRNYLASLTDEHLRHQKVNWGLRETFKLN